MLDVVSENEMERRGKAREEAKEENKDNKKYIITYSVSMTYV